MLIPSIYMCQREMRRRISSSSRRFKPLHQHLNPIEIDGGSEILVGRLLAFVLISPLDVFGLPVSAVKQVWDSLDCSGAKPMFSDDL
ncbi:hypothetical protein D9M68_681340 [compost metagenome]